MNFNFKRVLKDILSKRGFYKKSKFDKSFIDGALLMSLSNKKEKDLLRIIQVGANDGNTGDYLCNFLRLYGDKITILFVEPQINLRNQLLANTKNICKKTSYAFVAVTKCKNEKLKLYVPHEDKIPNSSLLASFDRNQVLKRFRRFSKIKDPKLNKDYSALEVPQKTLTELSNQWEKSPINKKICDVLIVDAEGFDDEVIYSLNDVKKLPNLISFEWKNLTKQKYNNLEKYLSIDGFKLIKWSKADAVAIRP